MENKQTAMNKLMSFIEDVLEFSHNPLLQKIVDSKEHLLELERGQIKDAWLSARKDSMLDPLEDKYYEPEAEQYYNETYKSNNQ